MKLAELRDHNPPDFLPKIEKNAYRYIWISDYWDAPLAGMLQIENQLYWFEMTQENTAAGPDAWYRRYAVIRLTKQQLAKEQAVHRDFQRYVGTHWDQHYLRPAPRFVPGSSQKFYDLHLDYVRSPRFEENEVIGWFEI